MGRQGWRLAVVAGRPVDYWNAFNSTVKDFRRALDQYRFDQAAAIAYEFTWNQFCDWYLELTKPVLQKTVVKRKQRGTRHTLVQVLEQLLRLLHPLLLHLLPKKFRQQCGLR